VNLVKGEGTVYPEGGKFFDPVLIPKAIHDGGFTATEVEVVVVGTLAAKNGALELDMPGLKHSFMLAGGSQEGALKKQVDLVGKIIRLTGKLHLGQDRRPATLSVENFSSSP
jgi:hypothetical protein